MKMVDSITALCDMLRSETDLPVTLGCPDKAAHGIFVWPWQLSEDPSMRNVEVRYETEGAAHHPPSNCVVHFLVLARPALTIDGLSMLETAREAILKNPILDVEGQRIRVILSPLNSDTLAALFSAASIPLTICLSARIDIK